MWRKPFETEMISPKLRKLYLPLSNGDALFLSRWKKKNEGCNVVFVTQLTEDTGEEFVVNNNPLAQAPKNSVAVAKGDGSINRSS